MNRASAKPSTNPLSQANRLALSACAQRAIALFGAEDRPLWKRTQDGMLAFKGFDITELPDRVLREIDRCFLGINKILAGYTIETWDDYQRISEEDLRRIQSRVMELSWRIKQP